MKNNILLLLAFMAFGVASAQVTDSVRTNTRKITKDKTLTGKTKKLADTVAPIRKSSINSDTLKRLNKTKRIKQRSGKNNPNSTVNPSGTTQPVPKSTTNSPKGSNPNGTKVHNGTTTVK